MFLRKVAAVIIFLGGITLFMYDTYEMFRVISGWTNYNYIGQPEINYLIILMLYLIPIGSSIYYPIVTNFGKVKSRIIDELDNENEIIKRKIQNKELLNKLNELEKKM